MISMPRISSPAIWGKLPDRGDYVRYRGSNKEIDDWRAWLDKQLWLYAASPEKNTDPRHWMRLTPDFSRDGTTLHALPWGFVLRPGVLSFSDRDWLVGVMSVSEDSIGRSYPIVIYQTANQSWLQRYLNTPQGWLFWLAQLTARYVKTDLHRKSDLPALVDRLWTIHSPRWGGLFPRRQSDGANSQALIGSQKSGDEGLHGVQQLPWANWPQLVWMPSETQGWFWQQNTEGGYLDARTIRRDEK